MTVKYHFNPETGLTNPCNAQPGNCPIRNEDGTVVAHGDDKESVQQQGLGKLAKDYGNEGLRKNSETVELDLQSHKINNLLQSAPIYKKNQKVKARKAQKGEKLETVLKDGTVETTRILNGDEIIVSNPSGEQYAMEQENFNKRYSQNTEGEWIAKGTAKVIKNPTGSKIEIMAPWGEKQYGGKNCFIAQSLDNKNDRYIIGHDEFIETYGSFDKPISTPIDENLPKTVIESTLEPKKGGSYYGLSIDKEDFKTHLNAWRKIVGEKEADEMEQSKIDRDGDYAFHITVFTPKETRQLKKIDTQFENKKFKFNLTGIGRVENDNKEAWFITADSDDIDNYRATVGLPKHNLHITLGFKNGDVHNKPKDETSWKII